MADMLNDEVNLEILGNICEGKGVSVNYSYLSKKCQKHRNTIKKRVGEIFKHHIINPPIYPFLAHHKEHPVLVMLYTNLPLNRKIEEWITNDNNIFAAYKVNKGEYTLLLFLYHRTILEHTMWRKKFIKILPKGKHPMSAEFFSRERIAKYEPSAIIKIFEEEVKKKKKIILNGYEIDQLSFQILAMLTRGEGIRTNENVLAQRLNLHRKTIRRRIKPMLQHNVILPPTCRFPNFFCAPDHILTLSLLEVKSKEKELVAYFKRDPHISLTLQIATNRYNYLLFKSFAKVEDHITWEEMFHQKFSESIGTSEVVYLTPNRAIDINQQKVSLGVIRKKLEQIKKPQKDEVWTPFIKEIEE